MNRFLRPGSEVMELLKSSPLLGNQSLKERLGTKTSLGSNGPLEESGVMRANPDRRNAQGRAHAQGRAPNRFEVLEQESFDLRGSVVGDHPTPEGLMSFFSIQQLQSRRGSEGRASGLR
mmetsp:Transcript_24041/g.58829  ORF Transcript_24041/g.58829 Transcript_24041/m.58829 type:complete len:119 (-) Transcript_24041:3934-4290(-)